MHKRAALILLFFIVSSFIGTETDNKIYWHQRKLNWEDFKGPKQVSEYVAWTSTDLKFSIQSFKDSLQIVVSCSFNPSKSWSSTNSSDYILNHEQRHFDIAEYSARLARKEFSALKLRSIKTVGDDMNKIFQQIMQQNGEIQRQYDAETNHSINRAEQEKWNLQIDTWLKNLDAFSANEFSIYIGDLK